MNNTSNQNDDDIYELSSTQINNLIELAQMNRND